MSRNILCVVEFDNYPDEVVSRATWLAKLYDADLHLLVSDPATDFLGNTYVYLLEDFRPIADSIKEYQEEALGRLMEEAESAGVSVETSRSSDRHVADMIRREADERQPLFVLKGTHYHTPSERASMADADWDLIRDLEYPIWFVKPISWREPPVIVAAVDPLHAHDKPAHLDKRIIETGQEIASKCSGDLQVLHTYQRLDEIGSRVMWAFKPEKLPIEKLDKQIRSEHARALKILGEVCNVPASALHMVPGRAHDVLPSFARYGNASLVIMGALARSKLKQRIVGSTAARVLDYIPCDVLVTHARQKS